jgi:hypothetical protein
MGTEMEFEWDERKAESNLAKHGISFVAALAVFDDPDRLELESTKPEYAERWYIAVGKMQNERLVAVVYTDRGNMRRIISVRSARSNEQRKYYQGKASA